MTPLSDILILSIFPGIDLLGQAFEQTGFCVVRGPDLITGGDVRDFHPPLGRFDGVIGGPPCQDFSRLNRSPGTYGFDMLEEYRRVVTEARPHWFLCENVVAMPTFTIPDYTHTQQRFALDLAWFSPFSRRRDFVFGSREGCLLNPMQATRGEVEGTAVTSSDERSFATCCEIQGLPPDFDLPGYTLEGKRQAVANAVPLPMGLYIATLIAATLYRTERPRPKEPERRRCGCGCGRIVLGKAQYDGPSCRQRAKRARDLAPGVGVTSGALIC